MTSFMPFRRWSGSVRISLVLPIFPSKRQGFASGGPNRQGLLPITEACENEGLVSTRDMARNAMKVNEIEDFLAAEELRIGEKEPGLGCPSCVWRLRYQNFRQPGSGCQALSITLTRRARQSAQHSESRPHPASSKQGSERVWFRALC